MRSSWSMSPASQLLFSVDLAHSRLMDSSASTSKYEQGPAGSLQPLQLKGQPSGVDPTVLSTFRLSGCGKVANFWHGPVENTARIHLAVPCAEGSLYFVNCIPQ